MGEPTLWSRFRFWVRPLVGLDNDGREVCCWFWQQRLIGYVDDLRHRRVV